MSLPLPSPTDNEHEKDETFVDSYCEMVEKLEMVLSRLSKFEEKSQSEKRAQSLLVAENNKMAAEITCLTMTVNEPWEENESIRTVVLPPPPPPSRIVPDVISMQEQALYSAGSN